MRRFRMGVLKRGAILTAFVLAAASGCAAEAPPSLVTTGLETDAPLAKNYWVPLEYSGKTADRYVDACAPVGTDSVTVLLDFHDPWTDAAGRPVTVLVDGDTGRGDANYQVRSTMELWAVDCDRRVGVSTLMFRCSKPMAGGTCDSRIDEDFPNREHYWPAPEIPALCAYLKRDRTLPEECGQ